MRAFLTATLLLAMCCGASAVDQPKADPRWASTSEWAGPIIIAQRQSCRDCMVQLSRCFTGCENSHRDNRSILQCQNKCRASYQCTGTDC
jgi:hypothetical protein